MTNDSLGNGQSFETVQVEGFSAPIGVMMPSRNANDQRWQVQPVGRFAHLTNARDGARICLEVNANGGATYMSPCGPQDAQRWQLEKLLGQTVRIRNAAHPGKCLDVVTHDTMSFPVMKPCGTASSQSWTLADA